MNANPFVSLLSGGDLRSVGAGDAAVLQTRTEADFDLLFACTTHPNRLVVMRSLDAVEKLTRERQGWLLPHKAAILDLLRTAENKEAKWHLAQLVPRVPLTEDELGAVWARLTGWTLDRRESRIVRVNAVQALFDLLQQVPELAADLQLTVAELKREQIPSLLARIRMLEKQLLRLQKKGWPGKQASSRG